MSVRKWENGSILSFWFILLGDNPPGYDVVAVSTCCLFKGHPTCRPLVISDIAWPKYFCLIIVWNNFNFNQITKQKWISCWLRNWILLQSSKDSFLQRCLDGSSVAWKPLLSTARSHTWLSAVESPMISRDAWWPLCELQTPSVGAYRVWLSHKISAKIVAPPPTIPQW